PAGRAGGRDCAVAARLCRHHRAPKLVVALGGPTRAAGSGITRKFVTTTKVPFIDQAVFQKVRGVAKTTQPTCSEAVVRKDAELLGTPRSPSVITEVRPTARATSSSPGVSSNLTVPSQAVRSLWRTSDAKKYA